MAGSQVSFKELNQTQVASEPVVPGQWIAAKDTGNLYIGFGDSWKLMGNGIEFVDSLPLAPVAGKLYVLKPGKVYYYDSGWALCSDTESVIYSPTEPEGQEEGDIWKETLNGP